MGSKSWVWEEELGISIQTPFLGIWILLFLEKNVFHFFSISLLVAKCLSSNIRMTPYVCCFYFWSIIVSLLNLQWNVMFLIFINVLQLYSNWHYLSCPLALYDFFFNLRFKRLTSCIVLWRWCVVRWRSFSCFMFENNPALLISDTKILFTKYL